VRHTYFSVYVQRGNDRGCDDPCVIVAAGPRAVCDHKNSPRRLKVLRGQRSGYKGTDGHKAGAWLRDTRSKPSLSTASKPRTCEALDPYRSSWCCRCCRASSCAARDASSSRCGSVEMLVARPGAGRAAPPSTATKLCRNCSLKTISSEPSLSPLSGPVTAASAGVAVHPPGSEPAVVGHAGAGQAGDQGAHAGGGDPCCAVALRAAGEQRDSAYRRGAWRGKG
jgi:hypothetical protein